MFDPSPAVPAPRGRTLTILLVLVLLVTVPFVKVPLTAVLQCKLQPPQPDVSVTKLAPNAHALLVDDHLLHQIGESNNFAYFPSVDLVVASIAKGGSTSLFQWLYHGITGDEHDHTVGRCAHYVQHIRSHCWKSEATYLSDLSAEKQRQVLTSNSTLRIAVQRDPFDRLISAFNDKFACVTDDFNADLPHSSIVPYLRKHARLPQSSKMCMNISEFASALDIIRRKQMLPLQMLDVHVRPQQLYFDYIPYHIVLDVSELSNASLLQAVTQRLPFRELVRDGIGHRHAVVRPELLIPEDAARSLYRFAMESQMGERRYLSP